jgi:hypothetical protein
MGNDHTKRLVAVLVLMVVALVIVSIGQLRANSTNQQQAAVLRAYDK